MKKSILLALVLLIALAILLCFLFFFPPFQIKTVEISWQGKQDTALPVSLIDEANHLGRHSYPLQLLEGNISRFADSPFVAMVAGSTFSGNVLRIVLEKQPVFAHLVTDGTVWGVMNGEGIVRIGKGDGRYAAGLGLEVVLTPTFAKLLDTGDRMSGLEEAIRMVMRINETSYLICSLKCDNNINYGSALYTLTLADGFTQISIRQEADLPNLEKAVRRILGLGLQNGKHDREIYIYHDALVVRSGKLGGC
ncbi:MAG: hypothetical protein LKE40_02885 [Spirochaetia bacterium]|jgi:hypothetical protein|nr:hypothetical protein [Spirochaetia bacterium]